MTCSSRVKTVISADLELGLEFLPFYFVAGFLWSPLFDHPEHAPLRIRPRQAEQSAAGLLDNLIGHEDVLRAGMDVAIEALHHGVAQRSAAGGSVRECADFGDHVMDVPQG